MFDLKTNASEGGFKAAQLMTRTKGVQDQD